MMERANKKAQTAMELAVFGAILIFVVGVIVRQALSSAYSQNQNLRAMRQAMTTSYRYSTGMMGAGRIASHQTASILFVEDRLTAESARHAAVDRTPYVTGGSATYSRTLFYPVESGEIGNLPVYDVFINGKHFPFTTAEFVTVELARSCANASPCPGTPTTECKGDCSATSIQLYPANASVEWENECVESVTSTTTLCSDVCNPAFCNLPPVTTDCLAGSLITWTQTQIQRVGCAKLYDVIYNHPGYPEWCDGGSGPCPANNLTVDERFDLDRDGVTDVPGTLGTARDDFFWQWYLVGGWEHRGSSSAPYLGGPVTTTQNTLLRGAGIGASADVDHDLKREGIMDGTKIVDDTTGVIKSLQVMDRQRGDLDMTRGDSDTGPEPGLQKNTRMYSYVLGGTYLLLEEGRLYDPGIPGQYIRTAQKKDQVDIIERTIQLSNNTGRFCSGSTPNTDPGTWTAEVPNPVEACQNCSSGANIQRTCMDQVSNTILVRSRIEDRRGRKWVTNTSSDDYVDFTLPSGP